MEYLNLQLLLLIIGVAVILFVLWDSKRRRITDRTPEEDITEEEVEEFYQQRDDSGYDVLGVGLSRVITTEDELIASRSDSVTVTEEPLVANRDDDLGLPDESVEAEEKVDRQEGLSTEPEQPMVQPDLIISVTVLAKDEKGFNGEKLLHCMLSRGLRFGHMDIFHRHKHTSGEGPVQFSLANALKPGTFNLDDMNSFQTRAVTLFMMLPGPKEPVKAYELLLDTAQHLATELGAQLLDDTRSALTQQTIQHFKEQIVEFERTQSD